MTITNLTALAGPSYTLELEVAVATENEVVRDAVAWTRVGSMPWLYKAGKAVASNASIDVSMLETSASPTEIWLGDTVVSAPGGAGEFEVAYDPQMTSPSESVTQGTGVDNRQKQNSGLQSPLTTNSYG